MKIAVVGAGAIGGYLGARLAQAGHDVTFIVRGKNLEAIHRDGFKLIEEDGTEHVAGVKAAPIQDATAHDVVLLAVKAQQVADVAPGIRRSAGSRDQHRYASERSSLVVFLQERRRP